MLSFWAPVDADPRCYGEIILLRLFETHPDVQKLFPKFVGLSNEQLQNNPGVQAHGEIVVCKLTEILTEIHYSGPEALPGEASAQQSRALQFPQHPLVAPTKLSHAEQQDSNFQCDLWESAAPLLPRKAVI
ncbi:MYG protein, partial [Polypterus senegalus]